MKTTINSLLAALIVSSLIASTPLARAGFADESEETTATSLPGAISFTAPISYDQAYDQVLTFLKKQDQTIDNSQSSRDNGQIVTAFTLVRKGRMQLGTRTIVSLIRENDTNTVTIKVTVAEQDRKVSPGLYPWRMATLKPTETQKMESQMKNALCSTAVATNMAATPTTATSTNTSAVSVK